MYRVLKLSYLAYATLIFYYYYYYYLTAFMVNKRCS